MINRWITYQDTRGDLNDWNCGCKVLFEEEGVLLQPCESERCAVASNLINGVDPLMYACRLENQAVMLPPIRGRAY